MGIRVDGDVLRGTVDVVPEMHVPHTDCLRTSIFAVWTDVLTGLHVTDVLNPRVPVTLELTVDLIRPPHAMTRVDAVARIVKSGRSVVMAEVEFCAGNELLAVGAASFMPAPDESLTLPSLLDSLDSHHRGDRRLVAPFAERAGCTRLGDGVASLDRSEQVVNASNTVNGGLMALVAEEAVLSGAPDGTTLASLAMRYLRPARIGPVVATATRHGDVAHVVVRDAGANDRSVVSATARTFG